MGCFVKICGLASGPDVEAVAALAPDALGFVFWPGSKRAVRADDVAHWTRDLPSSILRVGVFVDASPSEIRRIVETAGLHIAQLHGHESAEAFRNFPYRLWRSVVLGEDKQPDLLGWSVDAYLIDTYSPESRGGTGEVGDWSRARAFVAACSQRVLLAGGLTPSNVREARRRVCPWGVDVSSGVEKMPGRKDLDKVRRFIEICRED